MCCLYCNKVLENPHWSRRYCDTSCLVKAKRVRQKANPLPCKLCGAPRTGFRSRCDKCHAAKRRTEYDYEFERDKHLRHKYGLTLEDYNRILEFQGGVCAICKRSESIKKKRAKGSAFSGVQPLSVDHCHTTGKIRGLLCGRCNTAVGLLENDKRFLRSAHKYLQHHEQDHDDE